eukprot:g45885.t1
MNSDIIPSQDGECLRQEFAVDDVPTYLLPLSFQIEVVVGLEGAKDREVAKVFEIATGQCKTFKELVEIYKTKILPTCFILMATMHHHMQTQRGRCPARQSLSARHGGLSAVCGISRLSVDFRSR